MKNNIYEKIPEEIPDEIFEEIFKAKNIKIEKIVSHGHFSPKNFWYDQDCGEWILLLKGSAQILFKGDRCPVKLLRGDYLNIAPHLKHRVISTAKNRVTIWLAIYYLQ